jgi:NAD(P)-dependent dehydrogenase (short-subunit alcohol dehydrogenase family)
VSAEQIDTAFAANVRGAVLTVQKALPHLRDGSSIVLTGSTAAPGGIPAFGLYSASKAALHAIGRTLAVELAPRKIRVNTVVPGPTNTPGLAGLNPDDPQGLRDMLAQGTATGRLVEPDEVASAVAFLLSDANAVITGSDLYVDGGQSILR